MDSNVGWLRKTSEINIKPKDFVFHEERLLQTSPKPYQAQTANKRNKLPTHKRTRRQGSLRIKKSPKLLKIKLPKEVALQESRRAARRKVYCLQVFLKF